MKTKITKNSYKELNEVFEKLALKSIKRSYEGCGYVKVYVDIDAAKELFNKGKTEQTLVFSAEFYDTRSDIRSEYSEIMEIASFHQWSGRFKKQASEDALRYIDYSLSSAWSGVVERIQD